MLFSNPRWQLLLASIFLFAFASAEETGEHQWTEAEYARYMSMLADSLVLRDGTIYLPNGESVIELPRGMRYLDTADTQTLLVDLWGNPSRLETLGAVVGDSFDPFADDAWLIMIDYVPSGHVRVTNDKSIEPENLLGQLEQITEANNTVRTEQGFPTISLKGWADPPKYEAEANQLSWATQLRFADSDWDTLNYTVLVLGREGFLRLNAVANIQQLGAVKRDMTALLAAAEFVEQRRYEKFNPVTDRLASISLNDLVLGLDQRQVTGARSWIWFVDALAKYWVWVLLVSLGLFWMLLQGQVARRAPSTKSKTSDS